jgi:hypothetical protein
MVVRDKALQTMAHPQSQYLFLHSEISPVGTSEDMAILQSHQPEANSVKGAVIRLENLTTPHIPRYYVPQTIFDR